MNLFKITVSLLALSSAAFACNAHAPLNKSFQPPIITAFLSQPIKTQALLEFLSISPRYRAKISESFPDHVKNINNTKIAPIFMNTKNSGMMRLKAAGLSIRALSPVSYNNTIIEEQQSPLFFFNDREGQKSGIDNSSLMPFSSTQSTLYRQPAKVENIALGEYQIKLSNHLSALTLNNTLDSIKGTKNIDVSSSNNDQVLATLEYQTPKRPQTQNLIKAALTKSSEELNFDTDKSVKFTASTANSSESFDEPFLVEPSIESEEDFTPLVEKPSESVASTANSSESFDEPEERFTPLSETRTEAPTPPPAPKLVENHAAARPQSLAEFVKTLGDNPQAGLRSNGQNTPVLNAKGIPTGLSLSRQDIFKLNDILKKRAAALEDHATISMGTKSIAKKVEIKSATEMSEVQDRSSLLAAIQNFNKSSMKKTVPISEETAPKTDFKLQAGQLIEELKKGVALKSTANLPKVSNPPKVHSSKSATELDQELRQAKLRGANSLTLLQLEKQLALSQQIEKGSQLLKKIRLRTTETLNQQEAKTTVAPNGNLIHTSQVDAVSTPEHPGQESIAKAMNQPADLNSNNTSFKDNPTASLVTEKEDTSVSDSLIDVFKKAASKFKQEAGDQEEEANTNLDRETIYKALKDNKAEIGLSAVDLEKLQHFPRQAFDFLVEEFYDKEEKAWDFSFADATEIMTHFKGVKDPARSPELTPVNAAKTPGKLSINKNTGLDFLSAIRAQKGLKADGDEVDVLKIQEALTAEKARQAARKIEEEHARQQQAHTLKTVAPESASMPDVAQILNKRRVAITLDDEDEDDTYEF